MIQFIAWLKAFGLKVLGIMDAFINSITLQLATFKGALLMLFVTALVVDLILTGKIGIISYILILIKDLITIVSTELKSNGWQFITLLAILLLFKKSKI